MAIFPIKSGDIYAIHFRYHPLLEFDVVPTMVKSEKVFFRMFHPFDGRKDTKIYQCSIADFRLFFMRNMLKPSRGLTTSDVGTLAVNFTEEELRFVATGMDNKLF